MPENVLVRESREKAALTQTDVAEALGSTQSFISKCERGERRIDIVELSQFCEVMDVPLLDFVGKLQKAWQR